MVWRAWQEAHEKDIWVAKGDTDEILTTVPFIVTNLSLQILNNRIYKKYIYRLKW